MSQSSKSGKTVAAVSACCACMACVSVCPADAVRIDVGADACRPAVDVKQCVGCGRCEQVCQALHQPRLSKPASWVQGWAASPGERGSSSSGGFASAIARGFVERGGAVVACSFAEGSFGFEVAETVDDLARFKGSKYVKSNAQAAYPAVLSLLRRGRRVLFVGLPCQVAAVRNVVGEGELARNLYTIDLICHGTPSPDLLEEFIQQKGSSLRACSHVAFRRKRSTLLSENERRLDVPGVTDRYLLAFLGALIYTENCYACPYARIERAADLTLGDSWGSDLASEAPDGISLALSMGKKGDELLDAARLKLRDVDLEAAVARNGQLSRPSTKPAVRERFLRNRERGVPFDLNMALCLPKECLKQDVKRILVRAGLRQPAAGIEWSLSVAPRSSEVSARRP